MPIRDVICTENVHDLVRHGTSPSDVIIKGVNKLLTTFHRVTKESLPTKTWACIAPLSTAGVSEKTVSVATASCLLGMLSAGFLDLRCFFMGKVLGIETPHWVDCSMVI